MHILSQAYLAGQARITKNDRNTVEGRIIEVNWNTRWVLILPKNTTEMLIAMDDIIKVVITAEPFLSTLDALKRAKEKGRPIIITWQENLRVVGIISELDEEKGSVTCVEQVQDGKHRTVPTPRTHWIVTITDVEEVLLH